MNANMKNYKLFALLCLLGLFLASCEKEPKTEWNNYYGYAKEDIIGTYSFSNIDGVFNDVEGIGRHACPDAEIRIVGFEGKQVEFSINCPSAVFSRTFQGLPTVNSNDFMLQMTSGYVPSGSNKYKAYNVTAHVLKNAQQEIRLHGYAALNTYHTVEGEGGGLIYVMDNGEYYYFDVIKN